MLALSVFPAHAGMNRDSVARVIGKISVPRACGDEPNEEIKGADSLTCSPRMRG